MNSNDLRSRYSVEPILHLLERLKLATTIHRDVASKAELAFYLSKWVQRRYADYPILYLACDGDVGELWLGSDGITFDELAGHSGENVPWTDPVVRRMPDAQTARRGIAGVRTPHRREGRRRI